ncbi:MAG: phosphoglycerate kinase [Candidatus Woesearchaeota archaeon]
MKSIQELEVKGKRVLVCGACDVPLDDQGSIADDSRLRGLVPTLLFLQSKQAKTIVMGHVGRPKGRDPKYSMKVVADGLSKLMKQDVAFASDCVGPIAEKAVADLKPGGILVVENVRYHEGEEKNDPVFVEALCSLADYYVNDDFPDCHREYASTAGVPSKLPSAAGFQLLKELHAFKKLENPKRPYAVLIGGAKTDKITVVEKLAQKADMVLLAGVLANTFLAARGVKIGASKFDAEGVPLAKQILEKYGDKILLPEDAVVAQSFDANAHSRISNVRNLNPGDVILDIGHLTIESYARVIEASETVVWAGPIGRFEWPRFREGTDAIAHVMAGTKAFTLIGGGDSGDAVDMLGLAAKMGHVSTGGGASLMLLSGQALPGVVALR